MCIRDSLKRIQPLRLVCRGVCLVVLDYLNLVHGNHGVSCLHILADGSSVLGIIHEFLYVLAGEPVHKLLGIGFIGAALDDVYCLLYTSRPPGWPDT